MSHGSLVVPLGAAVDTAPDGRLSLLEQTTLRVRTAPTSNNVGSSSCCCCCDGSSGGSTRISSRDSSGAIASSDCGRVATAVNASTNMLKGEAAHNALDAHVTELRTLVPGTDRLQNKANGWSRQEA
eukprot:scaffold44698_cov34-Tisochrysis_lutea.AAC.2